MTDPERRLHTAKEAAGHAAEYLKNALWSEHEVTLKGTYDLSLTADREAGDLIRATLSRSFPGEGILEEDGPPDDGQAEWLWIVDPLDGTVNYHHRLPWFCVSVACYHRTAASTHPLWRYGRPVASVVAAPLLGQVFSALDGQGAWCGARRLHVSEEGLARGILSHSRGSRSDDQHYMRGFLERIGSSARKTRSHGAAALDLAYVAQGSLVGHAQRSLQPWDVAAGAHLVLEAGGHYHSVSAEGGDHVLAAGRGAFPSLVEAWT
ncbi:MAG: inositol monophosphatase family protein [Spirochaetales bacterium]